MARTQVFTDINAFGDAVRQLADVDAVGAEMLSRMLATERAAPSPGIPVMATVADDQRIRVAVMRASGLPLIVIGDVGGDQPEAGTSLMRDLVNGLLQESQPVDRFRGPVKAAESLARTWSSVTGVPATRVMTLLLYRLGTLVEPPGVVGTSRRADRDDPADAQLIAAWWHEFAWETGIRTRGGGPDPQALAEDTRHGRVVTILSDGNKPVAAAGHSPVVMGGVRIAPVYTPPEHRRRGYGAAVTVAAVRSAQRCGATEITLFADADYPASNLLYRGLGFDVVAAFAEFAVSPTPALRSADG